MDVTCQQCHTEYEFDETLVSGRGTTVKCTNCGHLFKVRRAPEQPTASETRVSWRVRGRDLSLRQVNSLRELQELITDGQLTEEDEISRSGAAFKRLGTIGELRPFFLAAQHLDAAPASRRGDRPTPAPDLIQEGTLLFAGTRTEQDAGGAEPEHLRTVAAPARSQSLANRTRPLSERPLRHPVEERTKGTVLGLGQRPSQGPVLHIADEGNQSPSASSEKTRAAPVPARQRKHTALGLGKRSHPPDPDKSGGALRSRPIDTIPDESFEVQPTQATRPVGGNLHQRAETSRSPERNEHGAQQTPRPVHRGSGRPAEHHWKPSNSRGGAMGDPATAAPAPKERRSLYIDEGDISRVPQRTGPGPAGWFGGLLLGAAVCAGTFWLVRNWERVPSQNNGEIVAQADAALRTGDLPSILSTLKAHGPAHPGDAPALQATASLHNAAAQLYSFQAQDWAALRRREGDATSDEGRNALRQARTHTEMALGYAKQAHALAAEDPATLLPLANVYRLQGELDKAEVALARARLRAPDGNAEASYVGALLAMDQHGGNAHYARSGARLALQQDPTHLRAKLLLVRGELAARDVAAARRHLASAQDNPRARALLRAIDAGRPPAPEILTVDPSPLEEEDPPDDPAEQADAVATSPPDDASPRSIRTTAQSSSRSTAARDRTPATTADTPRCRNSDCWTSLGAAAQARGDMGRAQHYFEQALQLDPADPEANAGLGKAYLAAGNLSAAVGLLRAAARANYSDSSLVLGAALRRAGRDREAREAYQSYLNRNPGGRYARAAAQALEALGSREGTETAPPREADPPPSSQAPSTQAQDGDAVSASTEEPVPEASPHDESTHAPPPRPNAVTPPAMAEASPTSPKGSRP